MTVGGRPLDSPSRRGRHHPRPGIYNAVLRSDLWALPALGTGHRLGIQNAPAGGPLHITDHTRTTVHAVARRQRYYTHPRNAPLRLRPTYRLCRSLHRRAACHRRRSAGPSTVAAPGRSARTGAAAAAAAAAAAQAAGSAAWALAAAWRSTCRLSPRRPSPRRAGAPSFCRGRSAAGPRRDSLRAG